MVAFGWGPKQEKKWSFWRRGTDERTGRWVVSILSALFSLSERWGGKIPDGSDSAKGPESCRCGTVEL